MADNNPKLFSIVVPVYNEENYLDNCIESVIGQTCSDYELILVDDGSKDASPEICDKYHSLYSTFVKVFHKENEGLLLTRAYGIEKASGQYIISLDSDDALRYDALESIKNVIKEYNADMIMFCASRKKDFSDKWNDIPIQSNVVLNLYDVYELTCVGTKLNNMALKAFKRECYAGREYFTKYSKIRNGEDLIQSLCVIDNITKPVYLDKVLYYYRDNGSSITNNFQKDFYDSVSVVGTRLRYFAKRWDKGDNLLVTKVYQRNLITCSRTIKEIIKMCNDRKLRYEQFEKIRNSDFFISSLEYGDVRKLGHLDRFLIWVCNSKRYYLFEAMKLLLY